MYNIDLATLSEEDLQMFDNLYRDILKKHKEIFRRIKKNIEDKMRITVSTLGTEEQISFLQDELNKVKSVIFEGTSATRIIDKLSKKRYLKNENINTIRLEYIKEAYQDPKMKEEYVYSVARLYSPPLILEYLISKITELKKITTPLVTQAVEHSLNSVLNPKNQISIQNKQPNQITTFQWLKEEKDTNGVKRTKRIRKLYDSLKRYHFIEHIAFNTFKKHFDGITQNKPINWTTNQYYLVYLIKVLKPYMNASLYNHKNPSTTTIAKHFLVNNNSIKISSLNVMLSNKTVHERKNIRESIDLIISSINLI